MTSNPKMALYKARSSRAGGLGGREARAKLRTAESRGARDALLMERRRIPLNELQEEDETARRKAGEGCRGDSFYWAPFLAGALLFLAPFLDESITQQLFESLFLFFSFREGAEERRATAGADA